jgi:hypothetical protein
VSDFTRSLEAVLIDITALEVNTMIVERIAGTKFVAWDTYHELFAIDRAELERRNIHDSLHKAYLDLRCDLEIEYVLLVCDPDYHDSLDQFAPANSLVMQERLQMLREKPKEIDLGHTLLPNPNRLQSPADLQQLQQLLCNARFARVLRKMSELKAGLDNRNRALIRMQHLHPEMSEIEQAHAIKTDIIYAQTVIQLDGDIINRYSQEILDHPQRDLILQIHKDSVASGEKQWRDVLGFILDLVQNTLAQVGTTLSGGRRRR